MYILKIISNNKMDMESTIKVMKIVNNKAKSKIRQLETEKKELQDINDELLRLLRRAEEERNKMMETMTKLRKLANI